MSYDITYIWSVKHATNELIYETETDSKIENKVTRGGIN